MPGRAPLVSVIIPCWNGEAFVGEAIDSALAQTYRPVEVIVIDDGSTDASLDVIRSYGGRIRWETGPNRGACAARNRGLALARGELIQFLDADDLLHPDKLSAMVPETVTAGPSSLCYCDWRQIEVDGRERRQRLAYPGGDPLVWLLGNNLPTSSPLHWRANLLLLGGFDEALPCCQEYDLHLRLARGGLTLRHLPRELFTVRRQSESVSSDSVRVYAQHLHILGRLAADPGLEGRRRDLRRIAIARQLAHDGRLLTRLGAAPAARRLFTAARSISGRGYRRAFGHPVGKALCTIAGPVLAERAVGAALKLRKMLASPV